MENCRSCGKVETDEEELIDDGRAKGLMLCQDCYDDGILDSNIFLALKYP